MNKKSYIILALILAVLAYGGFWLYKGRDKNVMTLKKQQIGDVVDNERSFDNQSIADKDDNDNFSQSEEIDDIREENANRDLVQKCEDGQWIDTASAADDIKSFSGKLVVDFADDNDEEPIYYLGENTKKRINFPQADLAQFFESREVEIQGTEESTKINVMKVRCAGRETDQNLNTFRQDVMKYIQENMGTISPEKGDWDVYGFTWPEDGYVYVEYEKAGAEDSDEETYVTYNLLLKVSKDGDKIKTEQVAFMKMSDSDDDWTIVSGKDIFGEAEDADFYDYDEELGKWVKM